MYGLPRSIIIQMRQNLTKQETNNNDTMYETATYISKQLTPRKQFMYKRRHNLSILLWRRIHSTVGEQQDNKSETHTTTKNEQSQHFAQVLPRTYIHDDIYTVNFTSANSLKMLYINARSIKSKPEELTHIYSNQQNRTSPNIRI